MRRLRATVLAVLLAGVLAGCASAAAAPSNRGWDAPPPDAVRLVGP